MKKFKFIFVHFTMIGLLFSPLFSYAAQLPDNPAAEIQSVMKKQVLDWNKGDIESLIESYKNAADTLYVSSKVIHGYQNILKRYLTQYPDREKMGKLSFDDIEIRVLSPDYAMVIGNWHLERKKSGNIGGIFTVLYEKTAQGWKIVVDHTS